jgi:hypothetical protein
MASPYPVARIQRQAALLIVPEKYAVQHERAGQHEYARAKSKAIVKVTVNQHGADPGEDHDGQGSHEIVNPSHGRHPVARIRRQTCTSLAACADRLGAYRDQNDHDSWVRRNARTMASITRRSG